ncbi:5'-3' exonuclease [Symbiobacterium thermophilum]|uniref:5'-3' exonuclease n=1 Tax=Symbiobacterium thermophilum TaxID=2734 RepID=UPI0035C70EBE
MLLVDGGLMFRTFFALPPMTDPKGRPVNAVYGFVSMLLRLLATLRPSHVAVAADSPVAENRRAVLYPPYKANRPECPPDLAPQFALLREVLAALNITVVGVRGYEADDLMGTMARMAEAEGMEVILLTGDRDAFQLLSGRTAVQYVKRLNQTITYDVARFVTEWGILPSQLADLKGLAGDASDNIPGIRGIGPKTAVRLLQQYVTLEAVLAHAHAQPGKLRQRLEEGREIALLSKQLATIDRHVPVSCTPGACALDLDLDTGAAVFEELHFRSLLPSLRRAMA